MISGSVQDDRPIIELSLADALPPNHSKLIQSIRAVVDTGCTGSLVLPEHVIPRLRPKMDGLATWTFANGHTEELVHYAVWVSWDSVWRKVSVPGLRRSELLVGMTLMRDYHLNVEVRNGGAVSIVHC